MNPLIVFIRPQLHVTVSQGRLAVVVRPATHTPPKVAKAA